MKNRDFFQKLYKPKDNVVISLKYFKTPLNPILNSKTRSFKKRKEDIEGFSYK